MAITDNSTCMHVDTLLRFLTPALNRRGQAAVTLDHARESAMALADAAHRHMGAGVSGAQVHAAWYLDRALLARLGTPSADPGKDQGVRSG